MNMGNNPSLEYQQGVAILFAILATTLFIRIFWFWWKEYNFYLKYNWDFSQDSGISVGNIFQRKKPRSYSSWVTKKTEFFLGYPVGLIASGGIAIAFGSQVNFQKLFELLMGRVVDGSWL